MDPVTAATPPRPTGPFPRTRLLTAEHLPFVLAAVGLVTLGAFENRAVTTVLPVVAEHLHGLSWFGAATAAPIATYVIGTTLTGAWADRRGPRQPLVTGLVAFAVAQAVAGLAPSMAVFSGARLIGGAAEGMLDVSLTVLIVSVLPEQLRPKMFATFATAWILPSLVGPGIAGGIAELVGWRWVFVAPLPLLALAAVLLVPSLRTARLPTAAGSEGPGGARLVGRATTLAVALAAVSVLGPLFADPRRVAWSAGTLVVGLLAGILVGRRILPEGTYAMRPGVPAVVALSGLLGVAFTLVDAFIPLMLTTVHHVRPAWAGVSLSVTGLLWAAGSWVQSLDVVQTRTTAPQRLRVGFVLIALGASGPVLLSLQRVSIVGGMALFALAAAGIGLASPTIATQALALTPAHEQGTVTAARALSSAMTQALGLAVAGAFLAAAGPRLPGTVFAGITLAGAVVAVVAAAASGRAGGTVTPGSAAPARSGATVARVGDPA